MKKDIQILLVDDHQVVRDGLQHMLGQEEDMEVVGQSASSEEALSQVEKISPNIVLMDIKMPGGDGIELTRQLLEKQPSCRVIIMTLYDEYLSEAIDAGAAGYLLKDIKRAELTQAIRQVHHGQVVISDSVRKQAEGDFPPEHDGSSPMLEELQIITPPLIDANQLMGFVSRAEEMLQSRILQMVGSLQGGTAITIPLLEPTPLENIINILGELSEVGTIGEKPLAEEAYPRLFKKADAIPRLKNRVRKTIFVTLNNS